MNYKNSILDAVNNTPLIKLNKLISRHCATVLVKCEYMSPTGSVKDRITHYIINQAEKRGDLKPGGTIVENTSGNTGMSLAMVAAVKGYRCIFTMPDKMSQEKIDALKGFGAEVIITPTDVSGDHPDHYVQTAKRIAHNTPDAFYVNQYHNQDNIAAHYHNTGKELWEQTQGMFDAFVASPGTGGTLSGVGRYIKEKKPAIKIIGIDPVGSIHYDLFHGKEPHPQVYKVEGAGEDIPCEAMDFSVVDEMHQMDDARAFAIARRLIREEGLFCGGASGLIVAGALDVAKRLGPGKTVIALLTDSASRYLSKFLSDQWMKENNFNV